MKKKIAEDLLIKIFKAYYLYREQLISFDEFIQYIDGIEQSYDMYLQLKNFEKSKYHF